MRHAFHPVAWLAIPASLACLATPATAQTAAYPAQPLKLVVGFAAGGPSDIVARAFADHAAKPLAQPIIVENKPGANAVLATEAVASSKPDGLTLLAAATNHTMIPALYGNRIKFDAAKSFVPICTLATSATVLVVGPSMPVKSVAELLARVKAKPASATYATPGQGSSPHLATEQFSKLTGASMVHVPYKGAAPAVSDLLGGQVDLSFATVGSVLPHLKSGKLKALAVASRQRSVLLPEVPTFEETGVAGFVVDTWYGLLAPAGTPVDALRVLTREASEFSRSPSVRERLAGAGLEPGGVCGDAFAAQISREIDANARIARELNLKAE
jgi:tripartite-type tricarboxylate transporter receptor subunit TctC